MVLTIQHFTVVLKGKVSVVQFLTKIILNGLAIVKALHKSLHLNPSTRVPCRTPKVARCNLLSVYPFKKDS